MSESYFFLSMYKNIDPLYLNRPRDLQTSIDGEEQTQNIQIINVI